MEYLWRLKIATLDFPFLPKIFVVVEHHCELNSCLHQDTIVDLKFSGATESADITPLLHDIWQSHYYQIILENVLGFAVSAEISQSYRMKNHFVPLAKLLPLVFLRATCFGDESLSIFLIFHYEDSVDVPFYSEDNRIVSFTKSFILKKLKVQNKSRLDKFTACFVAFTRVTRSENRSKRDVSQLEGYKVHEQAVATSSAKISWKEWSLERKCYHESW